MKKLLVLLVLFGTFLARLDSFAGIQVSPAIDQSAWTAYTPTITTSTGTITTIGFNVGAYKKIGKTVLFRLDFSITTIGTGAGELRATLPFTSLSGVQYSASGTEYVNHKGVNALIAASATYIGIYYSTDGSFPGASGRSFNVTGVYEIP
jgi:hypothetical protein